MILVGGINMITALLVLILERTPMIGILKALGARDWSIRKVFLYNAAYLIGLGLLWGNALGLSLLALQWKYRIFKFPNPEEYYMDYIPVYMDLPTLLALNLGVLGLCLAMLLIPSWIITRISPVRAIRFE
jgi:lipoprotein-releasing system permease protein